LLGHFLNVLRVLPRWHCQVLPEHIASRFLLADIEGKRVKITRRIEMYKGKPEIRVDEASERDVE
jgi:hypothetical protein